MNEAGICQIQKTERIRADEEPKKAAVDIKKAGGKVAEGTKKAASKVKNKI
ncbi:MAG: hypothetical protein ABSE15_05285 [Candidatus Bathyarchaeia archaeon]